MSHKDLNEDKEIVKAIATKFCYKFDYTRLENSIRPSLSDSRQLIFEEHHLLFAHHDFSNWFVSQHSLGHRSSRFATSSPMFQPMTCTCLIDNSQLPMPLRSSSLVVAIQEAEEFKGARGIVDACERDENKPSQSPK